MYPGNRLPKAKDVCAKAVGGAVYVKFAIVFRQVEFGNYLTEYFAPRPFSQLTYVVIVAEMHQCSAYVSDAKSASLKALEIDRIRISVAEREGCRNTEQVVSLLDDLNVSTKG
jgi:hypothetical protein